MLVAAAEFAAVVAELHDRSGGDATPVREWLRVGPDGPPWALDHDALVDAASDDPIAAHADGDDPLFIMYGSGTTGLPKGALHTTTASSGPCSPCWPPPTCAFRTAT